MFAPTTEQPPEQPSISPHWLSAGLMLTAVFVLTVMCVGLAPGSPGLHPADNRSMPITGFTLNVHHVSDMPLYLRSVDSIVDIGSNSLNVVTPWFVERVNSTDIRHVRSKCPTRKQLLAILKQAKDRGLHTSLLPIVLIENPGEKDWRGTLEPDDWDAWWESYKTFIDWFATLAAEAGVDTLSIGSELNTTEGQTERWLEISERVRETFDGTLTYSANWDRYSKIKFWSVVDVISVSAYFELVRDNPGAPVEQIIEAWTVERDRLIAFAGRWGKPLMLSEVGYPSLSWANAHPWNYVPEPGMKADHGMQARCWDAFFRAWSKALADPSNQIAGFYCYHWDPYHAGQSNDTGYGVRGKPAYGVIRRGLADIRELAARNADLKHGDN